MSDDTIGNDLDTAVENFAAEQPEALRGSLTLRSPAHEEERRNTWARGAPKSQPKIVAACLLLLVSIVVTGCARAPAEAPPPAPIAVATSYPVEREVTEYADFTARTAAVESVEVRARVWGYLDKVNFKEGALVQQGDVLFQIDSRTYQAELAQSEASIAQAEARRRNLDADYDRIQNLLSRKSASQADADRITANRAEAEATVAAATAARDLAKLNLEFTKVTAPVSGRVSRAIVTEGNLVHSGQNGSGSLLTTIVSVDPVYAYFDVDEHTVLRVRQLIREGKAKSARETELPVRLGLANEEGFPHEGTINFVDNQVNPKTGTLRVRGVFPNKDETISPGLFARVRVPIGFPRRTLLITDRAIDTDQGQKIVYVVDRDNKVVSRPIRVGPIHDGLRAIEEGLTSGDRVIVNGLQQVRPGVTVEPKIVEMPNHSSKFKARSTKSGPNPEVEI